MWVMHGTGTANGGETSAAFQRGVHRTDVMTTMAAACGPVRSLRRLAGSRRTLVELVEVVKVAAVAAVAGCEATAQEAELQRVRRDSVGVV